MNFLDNPLVLYLLTAPFTIYGTVITIFTFLRDAKRRLTPKIAITTIFLTAVLIYLVYLLDTLIQNIILIACGIVGFILTWISTKQDSKKRLEALKIFICVVTAIVTLTPYFVMIYILWIVKDVPAHTHFPLYRFASGATIFVFAVPLFVLIAKFWGDGSSPKNLKSEFSSFYNTR